MGAKLNRHAAHHQRQHHHKQRNIERAQHNGVSQRKEAEQAARRQHQPGFIPVPHRQQREVNILPRLWATLKTGKDPGTQIGAIEEYVDQQTARQRDGGKRFKPGKTKDR